MFEAYWSGENAISIESSLMMKLKLTGGAEIPLGVKIGGLVWAGPVFITYEIEPEYKLDVSLDGDFGKIIKDYRKASTMKWGYRICEHDGFEWIASHDDTANTGESKLVLNGEFTVKNGLNIPLEANIYGFGGPKLSFYTYLQDSKSLGYETYDSDERTLLDTQYEYKKKHYFRVEC